MPSPEHKPRRLVSYDQGAERINVSTQTFRRYVKAGRIRTVQIGPRRVGVEEAELDRFIAEAGSPK